jgi:SET domain-containing protein 6
MDDKEEYFIIERDSGEPDSEGRLVYDAKFGESSLELLHEQLKDFFRALPKSHLYDKRKRNNICHAAISQALTTKLAQYPTSAQEDEALLQAGDLSKRHRMAVEVRLGEKILLQEAIDFMQESVTANAEPSEERAAKRAKTRS